MTDYVKTRRRRFVRGQTTLITDFTVDPPQEAPPVVSSDEIVYTTFEIVNGADNRGYKSAIRNRVNATNALGASKTEVHAVDGRFDITITNRAGFPPDGPAVQSIIRTYGSGAFCLPPTLGGDPFVLSSVLDSAKARFVSNARSVMSPTSGGVILGELRETLHAIRHPAEAIRSSLSGYLNAVKKNGRGLRKASNKRKNSMVASTWLEYTFGWAPLLHDIDNAAESLARLTTGIPPTLPVRGYAREEQLLDSYTQQESMGPMTITYQISERMINQARVYGALVETPDAYVNTISAFGLRPHDVIPTIWELIPYSFVVDYFTNLGDVLSAASFNTTSLAWYGATAWAERTAKQTFLSGQLPPQTEPSSVDGSFTPGSSWTKAKTLGRHVPTSLVPSVRVRVPGIKQGFNIGALVAQAKSIRI